MKLDKKGLDLIKSFGGVNLKLISVCLLKNTILSSFITNTTLTN